MKKFKTASGEPPVLHRNSANLVQNMLDEVKANITILPELKGLIPPLHVSEYEQLKNNILQDGCREPLMIWQTSRGVIDSTNDETPLNVLIDGHNRHEICTEKGLDFKIVLRDFQTLQSVRDFMIDNQLGRRNLTPEQMSYLRGLKYRNEKQTAGRPVLDLTSADQEQSESSLAQRTQDRLAKEFGVSPRTIHRDREYSEGLDKLTPQLKQDVLKGKQKIPKELIQAVGRALPVDAPLLSLEDVLTFQEAASEPTASPTKPITVSNKSKKVVKEIAKRAAALNPLSSSFHQDCDELIKLLTSLKETV
ncbi:hypothetical protein ACFQ4C_08295 [Larkinella insperata]|uniref:ParB/Sulfiredoxin domain-containing protein n=1 Tax=Larkinella insperata TaxID=332158 RepID=A0ABW3Q8P2_9BACT